MAHLVPEQWLSAEAHSFERFFNLTSQYLENLERLTALNVQALRFCLAESQEILARALAAENLPEMLLLPTLAAPVCAAQFQSYGRQFFGLATALQRHNTTRYPTVSPHMPRRGDSLPNTATAKPPLQGAMPKSGLVAIPLPVQQDVPSPPKRKPALRAIRAIPIE